MYINMNACILYVCTLYMYKYMCIQIHILKFSYGKNSYVSTKVLYSLSVVRAIAGKWLLCQELHLLAP